MAGRQWNSDNDQYNRIFIIGAKDCSQADIRAAFAPFGEITDVYIPGGKSSRHSQGRFCTLTADGKLHKCAH